MSAPIVVDLLRLKKLNDYLLMMNHVLRRKMLVDDLLRNHALWELKSMERKQMGNWFFEQKDERRWDIIHACTKAAMDHMKSEVRNIPLKKYKLCLECKERFDFYSFKCSYCGGELISKRARVMSRKQIALTSKTNLNNLDGDPNCRLCGEFVPKGLIMHALMRRIKV